MRLETIPIILGVLFALAGIALVADAYVPDGALMRPDRRRRARPQRHLGGEAALGLGVLCVGVALIGRDGWRYTTVAVLAAFILCVVGLVLNWRYVRGMMLADSEAAGDASGRTPPAPVPSATSAAPAHVAPHPEGRLHAR